MREKKEEGLTKIVMRDTTLTAHLNKVFKSSRATIKRNTPLSLNLRTHVEWLIQMLKVKCRGQFVIVAPQH